MGEALTPEERKQKIRERYKKAVTSQPCLDIGGKRVVAYRRISPQSIEQATACELIVQYYQNYVRSHNWILKGVYVDEGQDHTALDKLLDDCRSGEIDLVIIKSASYISRDLKKAIEIAREFEARSVRVYFEADNILGNAELERVNSAVNLIACWGQRSVE